MSFYILFVLLNRPIEDVTVEYDKTLLYGRHIHSLFDLNLQVTCRAQRVVVMLYSVLSCIAEVWPKPKQYKSLLVGSTASNEGPHEAS